MRYSTVVSTPDLLGFKKYRSGTKFNVQLMFLFY